MNRRTFMKAVAATVLAPSLPIPQGVVSVPVPKPIPGTTSSWVQVAGPAFPIVLNTVILRDTYYANMICSEPRRNGVLTNGTR